MKYNHNIDQLYMSIGFKLELWFKDRPEEAEKLSSEGAEELICCICNNVFAEMFSNPFSGMSYSLPGLFSIFELAYIAENGSLVFKLGKKNK